MMTAPETAPCSHTLMDAPEWGSGWGTLTFTCGLCGAEALVRIDMSALAWTAPETTGTTTLEGDSMTERLRCAWKNCQNEADPAVEGKSGDFDQYLCPYHDEVPLQEIKDGAKPAAGVHLE